MEKLADIINEHLRKLKIRTGSQLWQQFEVFPCQSKFIKGAFAPGIMQAAASVVRSNGKSAWAQIPDKRCCERNY